MLVTMRSKCCVCVAAAAGCAITFIAIAARGSSIDLRSLKTDFMQGEYADCISEGEKVLADVYHSRGADELYYYLGLSYLKMNNYLRASDIFEIIISEFPSSKYRNAAYLGLGDANLLEGNFAQAQSEYQKALSCGGSMDFRPLAYFKLAQALVKQGKWDESRQYLRKLSSDYPLSFENKLAKTYWDNESFFTVQVGSFTTRKNAEGLQDKLAGKGYQAYIEESASQDSTVYRVRVGKVSTRREAEDLQNSLTSQGFPARIFP